MSSEEEDGWVMFQDEGTSPCSPELLCARQQGRRRAAGLSTGGVRQSFPLSFCLNSLGDKGLSEPGGCSVGVES